MPFMGRLPAYYPDVPAGRGVPGGCEEAMVGDARNRAQASGGQSPRPGSFTKTGSPEQIQLELQKTLAARDIGVSSGLFYVPRVVEADPDAGRLALELMPGLRTLADLTGCGDARVMPALTLLGKSLAEVHGRLRLPPRLTLPPPAGWEAQGEDSVFIHGDLTMNNVCWDEAGDRLVIVDWSAGPALGAPVTFASRYLDLLWLCAGVFWEPSWFRRPLYPAGAMCDQFLASYASGCSDFSTERFLRYDSDQVIVAAFHKWGRSRRARFAQWARRERWARWRRASPFLRPDQ